MFDHSLLLVGEANQLLGDTHFDEVDSVPRADVFYSQHCMPFLGACGPKWGDSPKIIHKNYPFVKIKTGKIFKVKLPNTKLAELNKIRIVVWPV